MPAGADDREVARVRARGATADVGERVGVSIEELEGVVAAVLLGHVHNQRLVGQVQARRRVEGVDVRGRDQPFSRRAECGDVDEHIGREVLDDALLIQQGHAVDVGLRAELAGLLLRGGRGGRRDGEVREQAGGDGERDGRSARRRAEDPSIAAA